MEYEMESEAALFDASTNPSLEHKHSRPPRDRLPDKRRPQRAEMIPEEEEQAA